MSPLKVKLHSKLQGLLKGYEPHNVLNAYEPALFYKCLPDKTLLSKMKNVIEASTSKGLSVISSKYDQIQKNISLSLQEK